MVTAGCMRTAMLVLALGPGGAISGTARTGGPIILGLRQLDISFEDSLIENSEWGLATATFIGTDGTLYFNLAVNGSWQVRNMPLLSSEGVGVEHETAFGFDLGVPRGTDVKMVVAAFEVTGDPLPDMPGSPQPVPVLDQAYHIDNGLTAPPAEPGDAIVPPADAVIGGLVKKRFVVGRSLTNQDCEDNECVPAAVSNSLIFLNERFDLGLSSELISVESLKTALGWTTGGCHTTKWPDRKQDFLDENGIPVKSETVDARDIGRVARDARRDRCMIEMTVKGKPNHTVLVTGVTKTGSDQYTIEMMHDTRQGEDGGTIFENATYDQSKGKLTGGAPWARGRKVVQFVIQCYTP